MKPFEILEPPGIPTEVFPPDFIGIHPGHNPVGYAAKQVGPSGNNRLQALETVNGKTDGSKTSSSKAWSITL